MHGRSLDPWRHDHVFGQDRPRGGERATSIVFVLTLVFMVVETAAGVAFGSMALLGDGLHMGSHAVALGINAFAYAYARRHARDAGFAFGTGKVNALGGYTGAVLLGGFALVMAYESVARLLNPVAIAFDWAIAVAVVGLAVNGVSVVLLGGHGHDHHSHDDHHDGHDHHHGHGAADHNLRSAYLHVLADALTSVLAIVALVAGRFLGAVWLDPVMGVVGAVLVGRWAWLLLKETSGVLLDRQAPEAVRRAVRRAIEAGGDDRLADLHVWTIAPGLYAAALAVVTHEPRSPEHYKRRIPDTLGVAHATVEVHRCADRRETTPNAA